MLSVPLPPASIPCASSCSSKLSFRAHLAASFSSAKPPAFLAPARPGEEVSAVAPAAVVLPPTTSETSAKHDNDAALRAPASKKARVAKVGSAAATSAAASAVAAPAPAPKGKNQGRCQPPPFEDPVSLVQVDGAKWGTVVGVVDGGMTYLVKCRLDGAAVPVAAARVVVVDTSLDTLKIPAGAALYPAGSATPGSEADFLDFSSPDAPPVLYVRKARAAGVGKAAATSSSKVARVSSEDATAAAAAAAAMAQTHIRQLLDSACVMCIEPYVGSGSGESGSGEECLQPWDEFWVGASKEATVLTITCTSQTSVPEAAARLLAAGYIVSGAVESGSKDTRAARTRVKTHMLRWLRDADLLSALPGIVDYTSVLSCTEVAAQTPRPFSVYDSAMNVPRDMLCWGMYAAWVERGLAAGEDGGAGMLSAEAPLTDAAPAALSPRTQLCEPLQSYVSTLREFTAKRTQASGSVGQHQNVLSAQLKYNSASKPSRTQQAQALALYYWAAVHADEASMPISREAARQALELYLMFGHVVLRKRAYQFQQERRDRDAAAADRVPGWVL